MVSSGTSDVLPTVAALIGRICLLTIDGKDISELMISEIVPSHEAFYCYYGGGQLQAVRDDRFKLVFPHQYRSLSGNPGGKAGIPVSYQQKKIGLSLFDLDHDVSESKNVYDDFPEVVAALTKAAERARLDLGDRLSKTQGSGKRPSGKLEPGDEKLPLVWK